MCDETEGRNMNQFIIRWFLVFFVLCTMIQGINAQTPLYSFTAEEMANLEWGNQANQVALTRVPANNFGPPRLTVDQNGLLIYLLDSANQRILVFNTDKKDFRSIPIDSDEADDFCMTEDDSFYLLFAQERKIALYTSTGERSRTEPIQNEAIPLSLHCQPNSERVLGAFDGHFYRLNNKTPLTYIPLGDYRFHSEQHDNSQATLWMYHNKTQNSYEISIQPRIGTLDLIDLIGVDQVGHFYLIVEEIVNKGTDSEDVLRFLRKYAPTGQLIAEGKLPYSTYTYVIKDLAVTPQGEVFQMLPIKKHLKLIKWRFSTQARSRSMEKSLLSQELFSHTQEQEDDFEASEVPDQSNITRGHKVLVRQTRRLIMKRVRAYADYRFYAGWQNITYGRYLDGKKVVTPIKKPGFYQGIPYKWGGNDTLSVFKQGLNRGKKAGDICTKRCSGRYSGSRSAIGVDCSGFISQVWELPHKYSTRTLLQVAKQLPSKRNLQAGDILNKPGNHVRLFAHRAQGRFYLYEAAGGRKIGKVLMRAYTSKQLKSYKPYRYKRLSFENTTIRKRPKRLVLYGRQTLPEKQASAYRAKVFYTDGSYRDVTAKATWRENSPYAKFKGTTLQTRSVNRDETILIKAIYREQGRSIIASMKVKIRNIAIPTPPSPPVELPLNIDIKYVYRSRWGNGSFKTLKEGSVLSSGDAFKIIFTPTETTYIYIFQKDSTNKFYRLFPIKRFGKLALNHVNPTRPGKVYYVPSQNKSFVLDHQTGIEKIYFIAARKPDKQLEQDYQQVLIAQGHRSGYDVQKVQTQFERNIQYRGLSEIEIETQAIEKKAFAWIEKGKQFKQLRSRLTTCEGCVNELSFQHR